MRILPPVHNLHSYNDVGFIQPQTYIRSHIRSPGWARLHWTRLGGCPALPCPGTVYCKEILIQKLIAVMDFFVCWNGHSYNDVGFIQPQTYIRSHIRSPGWARLHWTRLGGCPALPCPGTVYCKEILIQKLIAVMDFFVCLNGQLQ